VSPLEHRDVGEYAESVTLYEYVEADVGDAEYVDKVAPDIAVRQAPSEYHWYESEGVPPDA
jgi:hypothetical protein